MAGQTWLTLMMGVVLFILVLGIFTTIVLLIFAIVEMKKLTALISRTVTYTEQRLDPLVHESELFVRTLNRIADDAGAVTCAVRNVAEAGHEVVDNLKVLSFVIGGFSRGLSLRTVGVRAGIVTAFNVLLNELKKGRSHHER